MSSAAPTPSPQCPDAEVILDFARGSLPPGHAEGVERHLDRCAVCARVVAEVAGLSLGAAPIVEIDEPTRGLRLLAPDLRSRLVPGTQVGRYIILSSLGVGGMGEVYAAHDRELDRDIALKILHANPRRDARAQDDAHSRLLREARSMARLHHPHVVPIHDVGTFDDRPFLAMERIRGGTLDAWLKAAPRRWQDIRTVFEQAGAALAAAHEVGLVHRDFKPSNVLVDPQGRAFVADFGLARQFEGPADAPSPVPSSSAVGARVDAVSESGWVVGTLEYMAPEQFAGGLVDARADMYSFCVALWEALHGRRPPAVLARERGGQRPRISAPGASAGVPAWLDRVLERGMQDVAADRFASMSELLVALQSDRRVARKRRTVGLVLALVLPAVLAMAWWWTRPGPTAAQLEALAQLERDARAHAEAGRYIYPPPEDPARPTAYSTVMLMEAMPPEIDAMAEAKARELRQAFATDLVASADRLWDRPGGRVFAIDAYAAALVFDPAEPRARERAGLTVAELAQLRSQAQALEFTPAELESAQVMARVRASESADETLWTEVAARERPLVIAAGLSAMLGAADREPSTPASPTEAIASASPTETSPSESSPVDAAGDTASAPVSAAPLARDEHRAHRRSDAATTAATLRTARAALDAAQLDEAERAFLRVVAEQPRSVAAHAGLGEVEFERGAYPKSIVHLQRAVDLAPRNVVNRVLLGDALLKVHRYREARDQYREAAELGSSTASERARLLDAKLGSSG